MDNSRLAKQNSNYVYESKANNYRVREIKKDVEEMGITKRIHERKRSDKTSTSSKRSKGGKEVVSGRNGRKKQNYRVMETNVERKRLATEINKCNGLFHEDLSQVKSK